MSSPVLELQGFSVSIPNGQAVVHDLNLTLSWGGRLLIEGRSGCGKSTLIKALRGLRQYTAALVRMPPASQVRRVLTARVHIFEHACTDSRPRPRCDSYSHQPALHCHTCPSLCAWPA